MRHCFTLLCCFLISATGLAQGATTTNRLEFSADETIGGSGVVSFGQDGLLIRSKDREKTDGGYVWHYRRYNTDLELVNEDDLIMGKKFRLDETYVTPERILTLFSDYRGGYIISEVTADFGVVNHSGDIPKKAYTGSMVALGNRVFVDATIKKEPFLLAFDLGSGRNKVIPIQVSGYSPKKISITNIQVVEESKEVFVFARLIDSRKHSEVFILRLNAEGEKLGEQILTRSLEENIVSISANYLAPGKYTFSGTYSNNRTSSAQGLFYCQTTDGAFDFFETYNFLDLDNFLSYLPKRKKKKIEKKKKRKDKAGKEFAISYRIASHNTIATEDGYLFLGEAYYPTYRSESFTTYTTINGVSTPSTSYRTVFDGYQYTHAIVCKFDHAGKLVWDRSFAMWPASKPFYVKRFLSVVDDPESAIKLIFASRNSIHTKALAENGEVLQEQEQEAIETGKEEDKVKRAWSNLDYWYDNYFYAFGWQKIKNKEDDTVKRKRKVYFVNKVQF